MKHYVKFIRRFYLPLLALAVVGLLYFGINGVKASINQNQPQKTPTPIPSDLKIVAKNNSSVTTTPSPQKTTTNNPSPSPPPSAQVKNFASSPTPQVVEVITKINAGRRAGNYIVDYTAKENAFELLKRVTKNDIQFTDWGDLGIFVDCIGEICRTSGYEYFWSLYINGRLSEVGSSAYTVKPNDVIEWKYTEADFRY